MEKIKFLMSNLWLFLQPFIKVLMNQAGQILIRSAINAVATVANRELGNEAKRELAFAIITTDLANAGIKLATSTINAALEAAVVKLKAAE